MKFINKWRIVLSTGIAAIAIPIAAHVGVSTKRAVNEHPGHSSQLIGNKNEGAAVKRGSTQAKAVVAHGVVPPQDYYDRRREYWEKRLERNLEYEDEYGEEPGDDVDKADAKDSKESKDSKKDKESKKASKDEDDEVDQEAEMYERRREYWRERLDDEW